YTHMAVAVSVLSGKADAGLGILAAARALELDFVPVTEERYDLIIPREFLELPSIRKVLTIIETEEFKQAVEAKGGYSTRETGNRVL
ncbi:MAG: substrate-binding domain-containing protein, partial [Thermodesulfobacteriota bacterium]|nr:substrate-binding domain-containing protein [Thermodesulfobacteriota bacterium]